MKTFSAFGRGLALGWFPVAALSWLACLPVAPAEAIRFDRDIRPILVENCLACHGPDPATRKAGLRLDTREGVFEGGRRRDASVVPGDPEASPLWQRIETEDAADIMPPPDSLKALKPEEKARIRAWILQGAPWEEHWAFTAPVRPSVPEVPEGTDVRNPIDAFVAARLAGEGLAMHPGADLRTLGRRVALDLTGLPPAPGELEALEADSAPDAYERYVERLLESPHWGEHRGRYWLDAARYADTHGLHFDNYREMWPYRDWVIGAFNRNLPFDRFTVEQLAGDLLEDPTEEQRVATGFQRCNLTTNEGGTIEEENLALYASDRVGTTGWVFLGLTANCAACHDHKFDPMTTRDFYALAAFYRNTRQSGFDRNWREGDGAIVVPQGEDDRRRWRELPEEIRRAEAAYEALFGDADEALAAWAADARDGGGEEGSKGDGVRLEDEAVALRFDRAHAGDAELRVGEEVRRVALAEGMGWREDGPAGPGAILGAERAVDLGDLGDWEAGDPWTVSAWVWIPEEGRVEGSVVARMKDAAGHHRGWDVFVNRRTFGMHVVHRWPQVAMKVRSAEEVMRPGAWQFVTVSHDGSGRASGVRLYLDGERVNGRAEQDRLEGSVRVDLPLRVGSREKEHVLDGAAVQDLRLHRRALEPYEVRALAAAPTLEMRRRAWGATMAGIEALRAELAGGAGSDGGVEGAAGDEVVKREAEVRREREAQLRRWEAEAGAVRDSFRVAVHGPTAEAGRRVALLKGERDRIRGRSPVTHIQQEREDSVPTARILRRGEYDKPGDEVTADTPGFLPPMPEGAPRNRLGLAQWLVSPGNPLLARVTVNRFWQEVFGTGIVRTTEDFGTVGEAPVNQELLDWLAVEFRESGWDVKRLFTLMVTSAAYRQSAVVTAEKLERDRDNRLLSRGPRFRLDAEAIRDYALATSGLLVPRLGGPSVRPYQPVGVWEAVAMPESNTRHYEQDSGEALYRRSLYTFWKRAAPPATMEVFNAPSREVCSVRRERTNTPLQALATLNDPTFVEAARVLAEAAWWDARGIEEAAIDALASRVLLRGLTDAERSIVRETLDRMREHYEAVPEDALRLLGVGESPRNPVLAPAPVAALAMVANQLLNLDEVLNK
ncbi:MAG: DUF1553 domain-containing protein [Verrucomicrobiae bacterium]|nr:DUF1553 domain-containing protein [Verrucomicrobiae bacterium]